MEDTVKELVQSGFKAYGCKFDVTDRTEIKDPDEPIEVSLKEIDKYVVNGPFHGIVLEPGYCKPEPLCCDDRHLYPIYIEVQGRVGSYLASVGDYAILSSSILSPRW